MVFWCGRKRTSPTLEKCRRVGLPKIAFERRAAWSSAISASVREGAATAGGAASTVSFPKPGMPHLWQSPHLQLFTGSASSRNIFSYSAFR